MLLRLAALVGKAADAATETEALRGAVLGALEPVGLHSPPLPPGACAGVGGR